MVIGRYALFEPIAAGGMATVHYGQLLGPVGFSRVVAIKRLHPHLARDPEFVSGFLDEARLAARIRHPNVVPTLDVVATKGELFVVMEYVQGEPLSRILRALAEKGQVMPPRIVASILSGTLQGLHAAHEATDEHGRSLNIVHRDISPQNILVGADGSARVLDFGIAKAVGIGQTTQQGHLKGKISYMAPEQLRAKKLTRHADIYAAAVVLWESLTGQRLFKGETEALTFAKALEGEVPPPSSIDPDLAPFDAVVAKGLARNVEDRYPTAREMGLAVERCMGTRSSAEVAEWLAVAVGPVLERRAATVAQIETGGGTPTREEVDADIHAITRGESVAPPAPASSRSGVGASLAVAPSPEIPVDVTKPVDTTDFGTVSSRDEVPMLGGGRATARVAVVALAALGIAGASIGWFARGTRTPPSVVGGTVAVSAAPPPPVASVVPETRSSASSAPLASSAPAAARSAAPPASPPTSATAPARTPPAPVARPAPKRSRFDDLGGRE